MSVFAVLLLLNYNSKALFTCYRSQSRSKSRSRSHSFSPPAQGENGQTNIEEEKPNEDDEAIKLKEEAINALPPYFPALQVIYI